MKISDLPSDMIEEILFRVPATLLGKSRFTCKRWNALVKNPRFIKKHSDKADRQSLVITQMDYGVYSTSFNLDGIQKSVDPFIEYTHRLCLIDPRRNAEVCISQVFHCEGLLLCVTMDMVLAVWNPCTGQTMWLKPRKWDECLHDTFSLGYTNNKVCRSYKILRQFTFATRMEVYEFFSNSWRVLDDDHNCKIRSCSVSLKGHIYWLASHNNVQINGSRNLLLRLDFSTEKFGYLPPPQSFGCGHTSLVVVREEQLSALQWSYYAREIQIWVSTKIETTNVSWSNFLKVSLLSLPYLDNYNANFSMDYDKKVVVCSWINGRLTTNLVHIIGSEEHIFRKFSLGESPRLFRRPVTFHYVPSLVRFHEGAGTSGHKRKRT